MNRTVTHITYHVIVVLLSATLALFMPLAVSAAAGRLLHFWAFIENEKIFLVVIEIFTAVTLILFFNVLKRGWEDRRLARTAKNAGMVPASAQRGIFVRRRAKKMKTELGFSREVMIIGSTGYHSFVEPEGDLHDAVLHCREARIMLLDPLKEGAITRARTIPDPEITPEVIRDQIIRSIDFLKGLRAVRKDVRLKLYPDIPLLKLAIIGDYAFLRHYHTGLNVRSMPEYAFRNEPKHGGLYVPMYRYFTSRWEDPDIPEYDLDTDELVYRDQQGDVVRRERFNDIPMVVDTQQDALADIFSRYVFR